MHVVRLHYSTTIAEFHKQFTKDCDIAEKIQVTITDNAQNMVSTVNKIGSAHIPCFSHSLKLAILHGIKSADTGLFCK